MSVKTTTIFTRENSNVLFFIDANDVTTLADYVKKNYFDTGKIVSRERTLSEDGLKSTFVVFWKDMGSLEEFVSDQYCINNYFTPLKEYNEQNNISSESLSETV